MGIALKTVTTVASIALLARLLSPSDFGHVAMATVVTELAALLGNFGLSNVLIQKRRVTRLQLDTVFWTSLGIGAILASLVFCASYLITLIFPGQDVGGYLRALSLTFIIGSLGVVPAAILSRMLLFREQFYIQIGSKVGGALSAVFFAYFGYGAWSLVAGALVSITLEAVLGLTATRYSPRFRFQVNHLVVTWRTSGGYLLSGLLYYVNMNLDLALVGRTLGPSSLGYYQNARALTDEIRARIAVPLQHVLFPAFSVMQEERSRLQLMVMSSGRLLAAVVIPIGFGVAAVAPELVLVLYGSNWSKMAPVMSLFGFAAAIRAATAIASPIFNSSNRVGLALRYNFVGTVLTIGAVLLVVDKGIEAVAVAVALSSLYSLVTFRAGLGLIGMGNVHVAKLLAPPIISAFIMWGAIGVFRELAEGVLLIPVAQLCAQVAIGTCVYAITLHAISRLYYSEFKRALARLAGRP